METRSMESLQAFHWTPQPATERLVQRLVTALVEQSELARQIQQRLLTEAGVRFGDMVDHLALPRSDALEAELSTAGYVCTGETQLSEAVFTQPGGIFPRIVLTD
jgi:hypothetical protein